MEYRERASWAFAICSAPHKDAPIEQQTLLSWHGGLLQDKPLTFINRIDSTNAEAAALFWAGLYALAHHRHEHEIVFCYDSDGIGQAVAGRYNYTNDYPLVSAARKLHQAVESLWGPHRIFHRHVKGHNAQPANELVNTIAQEIVKQWLIPRHPTLPLEELWQQPGLLDHLWLTQNLDVQNKEWPTYEQQEFLCPDRRLLEGLPIGYDWTFGYGQRGHLGKPAQFVLDLKMLTFNVQSTLGKVQFLRAQFHDGGYGLIGLQETASKESRVTTADGYLRVASQATKGVGGIDIWLSTNHPVAWAGNRPLYWDVASLLVLHSDSQVLMLRCSIPGLGLYTIISAHAPHNGIDPAIQTNWWNRLRQLARSHQHGWPLILLVDANAQIGSIPTTGIGDLHASIEDGNGSSLRHFVAETSTWIPSTFQHEGSPWTWYSNAAHQRNGRRLDYIAIPDEWHSLTFASILDDKIDHGHQAIDHVALSLSLRGTISGRKFQKFKGDGVDWRAVRRHQDEETWRDIFHNIPHFEWNLDTHRHWAELHAALVQQLRLRFPRQARTPRRHYISSEAWTLRNTRNHQKRLWRSTTTIETFSTLRAALHAWQQEEYLSRTCSSLMVATLSQALRGAASQRQLQGLSKKLKKQIRQDKEDYIRQVVQEANYDPANLYKVLRQAGFGSARRKRCAPLPCLHHHGQPCEDIEALQKLWIQHFAGIEGGYETSNPELLQLCKLFDAQKETTGLPCWESLPSLKQLEDGFRRCQSHKAAGPDGLVPEFCRKASKWMARITYPLLAKMTIYKSEPLQWKGGVMHTIWKKRGAHTDPASYRAILVSSQVGKTIHHLFRTRALPSYMENALPLQCGGIPGRAVGHAAQAARLQQSISHQQQLSTAVLFLDVRNAFYRLLRELCIDTSIDKNQLAFLLQTLQISSEELLPIWNHLHRGQAAMETMDLDETIHEMAKTFHQGTWFHMTNSPMLARTLRGTRPGDPWADLLFNHILVIILRDLQHEAVEWGIQCQVLWDGQRGLRATAAPVKSEDVYVSAWADDMAFMLWHESAPDLVTSLSVFTSMAVKHLAARGLQINLSAGKSEATMHLRGPHSVALRREIFGQPDPHVNFDCLGQPERLRVVVQYLHLGGLLHSKGKLGPELRRRVALAHDAFATHRTAIYQNPALERRYRVRVFEACILSVAFYNAGSWTIPTEKEWKSFESAILSLYRRLLIKEFPHDELLLWSTDRLCHALQLPAPHELLRLARLRYYGSVLRHGSDSLWALIAVENLWFQQVHADFDWLHLLTVGRSNRPDPGTDPDYWDGFITTHPGAWKGLLKKAKLRLLQLARHRHHLRQWHADFGPFLHEAGITWEQSGNVVQSSEQYVCLPCEMAFKTKAAWGVHCFKKHGRKAKERFLAAGTACDKCGKCFLSSSRLVMHLQYNAQCSAALCNRGVWHEPEPGLRSRQWQQAEKDDRCPWRYTEGPRLPDPEATRVFVCPEAQDLYAVLKNTYDTLATETETWTIENIVDSFRHCCAQAILLVDDIREILHDFLVDMEEQEDDLVHHLPLTLRLGQRKLFLR